MSKFEAAPPGYVKLFAAMENISAEIAERPSLTSAEWGQLSAKVAPVAPWKKSPAIATPGSIQATPFVWIDPSFIPRRQWLYGNHYVRKFISLTVAPGAYGKSTLAMREALAIVTGRSL